MFHTRRQASIYITDQKSYVGTLANANMTQARGMEMTDEVIQPRKQIFGREDKKLLDNMQVFAGIKDETGRLDESIS